MTSRRRNNYSAALTAVAVIAAKKGERMMELADEFDVIHPR